MKTFIDKKVGYFSLLVLFNMSMKATIVETQSVH